MLEHLASQSTVILQTNISERYDHSMCSPLSGHDAGRDTRLQIGQLANRGVILSSSAALVFLLLLSVTGCSFTLDQLVPSNGGYSVSAAYGRAYFLKKGWFGSRVTVCDVQQATGGVICYDTGAPQ